MDVVRFGVGNRRPEGPPGTVGITGQVIHTDGRGVVSELAFARNARIEPHSNPNTTWFIVIEGGGWVAVGEDRARVSRGRGRPVAGRGPARGLDRRHRDAGDRRRVHRRRRPGGPAIIDGAARPALGAPVTKAQGGLADRARSADATTREGEPY